MGSLLTTRDLEILDVLTRRVRVLSLEQIARTWWASSAAGSRVAVNRLRLLAAEGLLRMESAPAHPELQLDGPVLTWNLGEGAPDFSPISYQLQSRWGQHPVLTTCISASKMAANRFGGYGGRLPRAVERTHDIHMAQVYLFYRIRHPELVPHWVFEEQIKSERRRSRHESAPPEKLPDAVVRSGSFTRAVEFGGAYGKDKLAAFHRYCKEYTFSYEIW